MPLPTPDAVSKRVRAVDVPLCWLYRYYADKIDTITDKTDTTATIGSVDTVDSTIQNNSTVNIKGSIGSTDIIDSANNILLIVSMLLKISILPILSAFPTYTYTRCLALHRYCRYFDVRLVCPVRIP